MPGILQNAPREGYHHSETPDSFDRRQVLENTELNAKLGKEGDELRRKLKTEGSEQEIEPVEKHASFSSDTAEPHKKKFPKTKAPIAAPRASQDAEDDDVHFNDVEISEWDKQRGQTEKIDEPNTPYLGTAKDTEYYDEDPVPGFDLGESE